VAWNIPNVADAAFGRQSGIYASDLAGLVASLAGDGVLSGCGVTAQGSPDTTVAVAAGLIRIQGYFCYVTAGNVTSFSGDATNPRIDLVVVDYNGALSRVAGTAAAQPVSPAIPANSIALAQVYVPANDTAIGSNQITDRRVLVPDTFDYADEFLSSNLSGTTATITGNVGELGWTVTQAGTAVAPTLQAGVTDHPGIFRTNTSTTSGNQMRLTMSGAANTAAADPTQIRRLRGILSIPTITTITCKFGIGQDLSDATAASLGTAGAWFEFVPATDSHWRTVTRQAGTATANNSTVTVTAGNWYKLDIVRMQNGNWQFAINDALVFTHSANQPTTACTLGTQTTTLTTAARTMDHDFIGFNFGGFGNRFT
jgi:hypothetical protein